MSLHEALGGSARSDVAHRGNPLPRDELTTQDLCSATCLRSRMSSAVTSLQIPVTAEHRGAKPGMHHGLTVVSRDTSDFTEARVPVLDPWTDGTKKPGDAPRL